jgi:hypothetical protein
MVREFNDVTRLFGKSDELIPASFLFTQRTFGW